MSQSRPNNPGNPGQSQQSLDDQRLLDALVQSGFDATKIDSVLGPMTELDSRAARDRAHAITGLLGLMKDYPVENADQTLHHATLARIDRAERENAQRLNFKTKLDSDTEVSRGRRLRLPDFMSVAAVLLIGVGIFWPMLSNMRQQSMDMACANNLRVQGYAFGNYAADNDGALPVATAGLIPGVGSGGNSWAGRSSTLATHPLIAGNYCEEEHLNCPGHHHHEDASGAMMPGPSYSFRWVQPGTPVTWTAGLGQRVTIIVGDLNPVVDAARAGSMISPLSVSLNHNGRGQNVLSSDGATLWLAAPLMAGDNIWLPEDAEVGAGQTQQSKQQQRPVSKMTDVFLTH